MWKSIFLVVAASTAGLFISTAAQATTGNWIGPTQTNWNDATHWLNGTIPNGQGDIAQEDTAASGSQIAKNDIANVTVGTLKVFGTANNSMQFTPNQNIVMDQDGAGPLRAQWINDIQSTGATSNPALFLNAPDAGNSGSFVLHDDLLISNTSNSTRGSGSVQIRGSITGAGNIWVENVSNDIGHAQVAFTQSESGAGNGFSGNVTIAKGAATFTRGDVFTPSPGNFVTIGSAGGGDATLAAVGGGLGNIENNFVAAANTGGISIFAANSSNSTAVNVKSTNTNAAFITLNGDLSFDNRATNGSILIAGDPITGVGKLTKIGAGPMRITNTNNYSGGTVVDAGSLAVGHAAAINNGFGFYAATDGTLGSGNVTVNSNDTTPTQLEIESDLAAINVIADSATLSLAGGGTAGLADQGSALLDAGINEVVGGLILGGVAQTTAGTYGSSSSGATFQNDEYFSGAGLITLTPAGLAGDFNSDGKVDAADYVTWRKNEIANQPLPNDNGAGNQASRFTLWRANFGNPPGTGSALAASAVPEPGALLLSLAGVLFACGGRRHR